MRKLLAVWAGKLLTTAGKIFGKKSSSGPGAIALKICPTLVRDMNKCVAKKIIVTCGTNGKTTTNNLICSALEAKGYKVLCNRVGANMLSGVATAYIQSANLFGKVKSDYACLEVDEAYTPIVFGEFKPDVLVVTNLFRDQLDRYGEVDTTSELIKKAIKKAPGIKLVLNGDDPLCVQFGVNQDAKYYGISEKVLSQEDNAADGRFCPVCGGEQEYNYYHYNQLGDYHCTKCEFKRPQIDFEVTNVKLDTPMTFEINKQPMSINYKGFYNIYNLIAVYGTLDTVGEDVSDFSALLKNYKPQTGRMQEFMFNKPVILSLSKNPAGFNQAISTVNTDKRKKDVVFAVNDMPSDGCDISWMWDVDFENIKDETLNLLACSGSRRLDIALRFKYANIGMDLITGEIKEAIEKALKTDSEVVYLIVNYTMLFPTESILKDMLKKGENNG